MNSKIWVLVSFVFLYFDALSVKGQNDQQAQSLIDQFNYHAGQNLDSSLYYATQLHELGKATGNKRLVSDGLIFKGLAYDYLNIFDEALPYYKEAIIYSSSQNDSLGLGKANLNIGVNYFFSGYLDSAATYYENARSIFEELEDNKYLSYALNNLGQVYKRTGNYLSAIKAYQQALDLKQKIQDSVGIKNAYFNLSSLYIDTEEPKKALSFAQEAVKLSKILNDSSDIASGWINVGLSYKAMDQLKDALNAFKKAENFYTMLTEEVAIELYFNLADLYKSSGNLSLSRSYLIKMKSLLREDAFFKKQMAFHNLSYELAKIESDTKRALEALEAYQAIKEKYVSQSVQEKVVELERKYASEQQERKIAELELLKTSNELALTRSQNQRNLLIFTALLLLLVVGSVAYRYTKNKQYALVLAEKNKQISSALQERETLLKEIHHRVKNNLQVISSLLNLQAGSLKDSNAREAVKEGQARVKSMALIHQKLYSTDDVRGIDAQDYFENLAREIFLAFGVDEEKIEMRVEAAGMKMDIDTVIPLGLIVNELLTNSIKYGFEGRDKGLIDIKIYENEKALIVNVADDGIGLDLEKYQQSNSFGWKMIRSLGRKLKADIKIENDYGTKVYMQLGRYKLVS